MRILLAGGGTIGPVTPLIAIYQEIKRRRPEVEFLWVGTKDGPEGKLLDSYGITRTTIPCGKFRRYFSWRNLLDPFLVLAGFFAALSLIRRVQPNVVLSAGGYVAVPVSWAAKLLRRPVMIHQQDLRLSLANKLMRPVASIATVALPPTVQYFRPGKTAVVGNPVRTDILAGFRQAALVRLRLNPNLQTVLVIGGGTGAYFLNELVLNCLPQLVAFCQIVHITGGRLSRSAEHGSYRSFDFVNGEQLRDLYAVADLVVSRAGMGVLSELAVLGKPAALIPLPASPQVDNAAYFLRCNAAVVLPQAELTPGRFALALHDLLADRARLAGLARNIVKVMPADAASRIADMIL